MTSRRMTFEGFPDVFVIPAEAGIQIFTACCPNNFCGKWGHRTIFPAGRTKVFDGFSVRRCILNQFFGIAPKNSIMSPFSCRRCIKHFDNSPLTFAIIIYAASPGAAKTLSGYLSQESLSLDKVFHYRRRARDAGIRVYAVRLQDLQRARPVLL